MAHKWARWLHNPCRLGVPHRFRAGGAASEVVDKWARWLHNPCRPGWSPPLQRGGQNQKWPTSVQGGYITPAAYGVPTASKRGAESEVAHKRARWLHNPCRLGVPHRFRAEGQHQKWWTNGQGGYITPAAWGVPTASERGAASEVAHKWAHCLRACVFSKIGNSFFAVRSCIFFIFTVNGCRKKLSHRIVTSYYFFLR